MSLADEASKAHSLSCRATAAVVSRVTCCSKVR